MAKKKSGGGGGANWMDTYGDMVTLLLCFFVLLYSMSTISEEKMKAIMQSFNPNAITTQTDPEGHGGPLADPLVGEQGNGFNEVEMSQNEIDNLIEELFVALQNYSHEDGMESSVSVSKDEGGVIYLKLMDRAMFAPDTANLLADSYPILDGICSILEKAKGAIEEIRIEGHTAQAQAGVLNPVRRDRQLSSERATEVTIYLQEHTTIHPARIESVGLGQWHAITTNQQDEASRAPNRRVELVISARDLEEEALGHALSQYITDDNTQASQPPAN